MGQNYLLLKKAFFVFLSLATAQNMSAQTDQERGKIKSSYQKTLQKKGKGSDYFEKELYNQQIEIKEVNKRVENYLRKHPGLKRSYKKDGRPYYIQDIRPDGTPIIITTKDRQAGDSLKSTSMYDGGSLGLNITGKNMIAGIWDAGLIRTSHELFQGRALVKDTAKVLDDHMCHVAGDLMGGDIAAKREARGTAFEATAWCFDFENDKTEYSKFGSDGYLLSNHSYGRGNTDSTKDPIWSFGAYDQEARSIDTILAARPNYLQVWAVGNEQTSNANYARKKGYDVMTGASASKNTLGVGALNADNTMSAYSNWGPTDDGRIKPDICAKGTGMVSAYSATDNTYNSGDGTSYATPAISGLALLLQQYYKSLNPDYLDAAGLRGLLMHTATDLGQPGPDYKFGWGIANGEKAAITIMTANADLSQFNSESKISKISTNPAVGSSASYTVKAKGGTPLYVSISWTDDGGPEQVATDGIDPTMSRLVYNFDVKVTAPDGTTTFFPWSGPGMANRTQNSTRTGVNTVDNFERVDIDNPIADGNYTITVTKATGSPGAARDYTLIATGLKTTLPEINFNQPTNTAAEATAAITNTCVYYKDYTLPMTIANPPSGDAAVILAVDAASSAKEGKHFDISTNNIFGAGSSKTLTFPGGSIAPQSYTIRIYDDAIVNPNERINLSFTTTGGNAVIGKNAAKTIISITDNDNPVSTIAPATITIGDASGTSTQESGPFSFTNADLLMDHYFSPVELTAAGLVAGSNITGLTLNIARKQTTTPFPNFKIRMGHVNAAPTATSAFLTSTGYTDCFSSSSYSTVAGNNTFNFSAPFVWDGKQSVAVRYCYDGTADRGNTDYDQFLSKDNALGTGVRSVVYNEQPASANANGCNIGTDASVTGSSRPVTQFIYLKSGTPVETGAISKTENMSTGTGTYYYYSAGGKLIAAVSAPSQDGGCTEAKIEAAGTGFTPFSSGLRSNKAWKITPSIHAGTIGYSVTLYMTTAELNGQDPSTLKIYKSTASNVASLDSSNTVRANTTVSVNPEYVSFTAPFTGFSLFVIGNQTVVLPLHLVNFKAGAQTSGNVLEWQTAEETSGTYFELEVSNNGTTFTKLTTVNSRGGSSNSYFYTDATAYSNKVYYRLKTIDSDGKISYSSIVTITKGNGQASITLFPSPAKDVLNIQSTPSLLQTKGGLYDVYGRLLQNIVITNTLQQLNVKSLPAGVYSIKFQDSKTLQFVKN